MKVPARSRYGQTGGSYVERARESPCARQRSAGAPFLAVPDQIFHYETLPQKRQPMEYL